MEQKVKGVKTYCCLFYDRNTHEHIWEYFNTIEELWNYMDYNKYELLSVQRIFGI